MSITPGNNTSVFLFTLKGQILSEAERLFLECADDTRLGIKPIVTDYPTGLHLWQVIPTTDSTGLIVNVDMVENQPLIVGTSQEHQDKCFVVGRVVQLSERSGSVQFKVKRPGEKTLKLTLLSPDPRMKVGQLWSCTAARVGCALQIKQATPLDTVGNASTTAPAIQAQPPTTNRRLVGSAPSNRERMKPNDHAIRATPTDTSSHNGPTLPNSIEPLQDEGATRISPNPTTIAQPTLTQSRLVIPDPAPPTGVASEALLLETGVSGWELSTAKVRANVWEWEAFHPSLLRRARVQVDGRSQLPRVYQYPVVSASLPSGYTDPTRLVVTPLGGALGIGASCFRVEIGPYEVVLDCGTRPKGYDPLPTLSHLKNPDLLLISHAHQDHIGGVPVFHNKWPGVRMICTPGTREIAHVMLSDCLKVQLNEDSEQLFDLSDLLRTLFRLETQPIAQDFQPLPGLKVRFINAGHIVGAACIYLRYADRSLLYTGDYNTTSSRTTTGLRLADLPQADMLITEATYGATIHPARNSQESALINAIASVVQAGGNVLIPAFALGRAQEILLAIRTSNVFQKLNIPIYVDGLVRAVTDTFRDNLEMLPPSVQNLVKNSGREPFFNEKSNPSITPITHPRERPLAMAQPSVIVASSGMLSGGPSVYYAKTLLERSNAAIFISGYTDEESPGRLLQNLHTGDTIELDGDQVTVRAQIKRFNLSAHADKVGITQVINKVNPKHLVLIHGSKDAIHELARTSDLRSKYFIHIPNIGEKVEYGAVPEHLNPKQVAQINSPQDFEVEVCAEVEGAWIRIPESVESDPRWQMLVHNGVLKAKWSGIALKLMPISKQDLATEVAISSAEDCCAVCQNFDQKTSKCLCPNSPLSERLVDPTGYCLEYTNTQN